MMSIKSRIINIFLFSCCSFMFLGCATLERTSLPPSAPTLVSQASTNKQLKKAIVILIKKVEKLERQAGKQTISVNDKNALVARMIEAAKASILKEDSTEMKKQIKYIDSYLFQLDTFSQTKEWDIIKEDNVAYKNLLRFTINAKATF